jgi:iron complex outermembrane receptor protein
MKKSLFLGLLFGLISLTAFAGGNAKANSVKGTITDRQGNPLVGAKVIVKDLQKEVYTDFEGNFIIEAVSATEHKIEVSHVSFEDVKTKVDFSKEDNNFLAFQLRSR